MRLATTLAVGLLLLTTANLASALNAFDNRAISVLNEKATPPKLEKVLKSAMNYLRDHEDAMVETVRTSSEEEAKIFLQLTVKNIMRKIYFKDKIFRSIVEKTSPPTPLIEELHSYLNFFRRHKVISLSDLNRLHLEFSLLTGHQREMRNLMQILPLFKEKHKFVLPDEATKEEIRTLNYNLKEYLEPDVPKGEMARNIYPYLFAFLATLQLFMYEGQYTAGGIYAAIIVATGLVWILSEYLFKTNRCLCGLEKLSQNYYPDHLDCGLTYIGSTAWVKLFKSCALSKQKRICDALDPGDTDHEIFREAAKKKADALAKSFDTTNHFFIRFFRRLFEVEQEQQFDRELELELELYSDSDLGFESKLEILD